MTPVSSREVTRQYRVLRQTLSIHAALRDKYVWRAKTAKAVLVACSVVFTATTFAGVDLYNVLRIDVNLARVILGAASIVALIASAALLVVDWEGLAAVHGEAVKAWTPVLALFRELRSDDGTWTEHDRQQLSNAYWGTARIAASIPDKQFNRLKLQYLRKVAVSRFQDRYPGCPRPIAHLLLILRDTIRALRGGGRHEDSQSAEGNARESGDRADSG